MKMSTRKLLPYLCITIRISYHPTEFNKSRESKSLLNSDLLADGNFCTVCAISYLSSR
jgi:hypothetical protein